LLDLCSAFGYLSANMEIKIPISFYGGGGWHRIDRGFFFRKKMNMCLKKQQLFRTDPFSRISP